jgi:phosphate-selective porin
MNQNRFTRLLALAALAVSLLAVPPATALDLVEDRLALDGAFDVVAGRNLHDSGTTGFDAYHWMNIFRWRIDDTVRIHGEINFEHGTSQNESRTLGELKTRAFVQLRLREWVKFNAGHFLVPFGIYNLTHDVTPAITSVTPPTALNASRKIGETPANQDVTGLLYAKEGTGVWLFGHRHFMDRSWTLYYDLYAINGRTRSDVNEFQQDDNDNKGVGGRLYADLPHNLAVGGSAYSERNGALGNADIFTWGLEATWNPARFGLSGEYLASTIEAHSGLAEATPEAFYVQAEYRLTRRLTGYARHDDYRNLTYGEEEHTHTLGINYRYRPQVFLKAEHGIREHVEDISQLQIAVAY